MIQNNPFPPIVQLTVKESIVNISIEKAVSVPTGDAPAYEGDYTIIPKAYFETKLKTKGKLMLDNVLVKKIPSFSTSNSSGGTTFYIASDAEMEVV